MQVLSVLAEHSPEVYESKAAEFSSQYWDDRRAPGQAYIGVDEVLAHRIKGLEEEYNSYVLMREQENKEDADNRYRNQLAVVSTKGAAVMVKTSILNTSN